MPGPVVFAKLVAKQGKGDELLDLLSEMVTAVAAEEGTTGYACHRSVEDPDVFWFYEQYRDREALGTHSSGEALRAAGAKFGDLLGARPEIHVTELVRAK
jgi:quinol monooxygenase YgiN